MNANLRNVLTGIPCSSDSECFPIGKYPCPDTQQFDENNAASQNFCYQDKDSSTSSCYWNENENVSSSCEIIPKINFTQQPCRQVNFSHDGEDMAFYVYTGGVVAGPIISEQNSNYARSCSTTGDTTKKYEFTAPLQQYDIPNASKTNIIQNCMQKCLDRGQECIGFSIAQEPASSTENCFESPTTTSESQTAKCALWTFDYFDDLQKMENLPDNYPDKKDCSDSAGLLVGMKKYKNKRQVPSYFQAGPMNTDAPTLGERSSVPGYVFNIFNQNNPTERWSPENEKNNPPDTIWTCEGYLYPGHIPKNFENVNSLEDPTQTNSLDDCWSKCMNNDRCSSIFFTANDFNNPMQKNMCTLYPYSTNENGKRIFPFTQLSPWNSVKNPYCYTLVKNDCDLSACDGTTDRCVGGHCACGSTGYGAGTVCEPGANGCGPDGKYVICTESTPHCINGQCQCKTDGECANLRPSENKTWKCNPSTHKCFQTSDQTSAKLSTGAIVGITIGSVVAVILLIVVIFVPKA